MSFELLWKEYQKLISQDSNDNKLKIKNLVDQMNQMIQGQSCVRASTDSGTGMYKAYLYNLKIKGVSDNQLLESIAIKRNNEMNAQDVDPLFLKKLNEICERANQIHEQNGFIPDFTEITKPYSVENIHLRNLRKPSQEQIEQRKKLDTFFNVKRSIIEGHSLITDIKNDINNVGRIMNVPNEHVIQQTTIDDETEYMNYMTKLDTQNKSPEIMNQIKEKMADLESKGKSNSFIYLKLSSYIDQYKQGKTDIIVNVTNDAELEKQIKKYDDKSERLSTFEKKITSGAHLKQQDFKTKGKNVVANIQKKTVYKPVRQLLLETERKTKGYISDYPWHLFTTPTPEYIGLPWSKLDKNMKRKAIYNFFNTVRIYLNMEEAEIAEIQQIFDDKLPLSSQIVWSSDLGIIQKLIGFPIPHPNEAEPQLKWYLEDKTKTKPVNTTPDLKFIKKVLSVKRAIKGDLVLSEQRYLLENEDVLINRDENLEKKLKNVEDTTERENILRESARMLQQIYQTESDRIYKENVIKFNNRQKQIKEFVTSNFSMFFHKIPDIHELVNKAIIKFTKLNYEDIITLFEQYELLKKERISKLSEMMDIMLSKPLYRLKKQIGIKNISESNTFDNMFISTKFQNTLTFKDAIHLFKQVNDIELETKFDFFIEDVLKQYYNKVIGDERMTIIKNAINILPENIKTLKMYQTKIRMKTSTKQPARFMEFNPNEKQLITKSFNEQKKIK